jgi:hypothetical protein
MLAAGTGIHCVDAPDDLRRPPWLNERRRSTASVIFRSQ